MDYDFSALINSAISAVCGFGIAYFWSRWRRPVLKIESLGSNNLILSHSEPSGPGGEYLDSKEFGFRVKNTGRSVAANVRFHLTHIETRDRGTDEFKPALDGAHDLFVYTAVDANRGGPQATIVPGASIVVHLAWWREDYAAICPAIEVQQDYYLEGCQDAVEYRFQVVAFADGIDHASGTFTIKD